MVTNTAMGKPLFKASDGEELWVRLAVLQFGAILTFLTKWNNFSLELESANRVSASVPVSENPTINFSNNFSPG